MSAFLPSGRIVVYMLPESSPSTVTVSQKHYIQDGWSDITFLIR